MLVSCHASQSSKEIAHAIKHHQKLSVDLLGAAIFWIKVKFRGAQAHTAAGEATSGPMRRLLNQIALREVVRTCDFVGELTWVAGVMRENEYNPRVFSNPSRLVVDVGH